MVDAVHSSVVMMVFVVIRFVIVAHLVVRLLRVLAHLPVLVSISFLVAGHVEHG